MQKKNKSEINKTEDNLQKFKENNVLICHHNIFK